MSSKDQIVKSIERLAKRLVLSEQPGVMADVAGEENMVIKSLKIKDDPLRNLPSGPTFFASSNKYALARHAITGH